MPADVRKTMALLKQHYPEAKYYLNYSSPLELMVAAILSAQTRDEATNAATATLFKRYKTAKDYAGADVEELISCISTITFAGTKARNIKKACQILIDKHKGKVPETMEELIELPGIGRKTANAILQNAFNKVEGVIVDTHVIRLSYRFGWTKNTDPKKIEKDLITLIPKQQWQELPWLMKNHGRAVCRAPVPSCSACFLSKLCPKQGVTKRL